MSHVSKIVLVTISTGVFIVSCGDNKTDSPYADILSQPAFAGITDSIKQDYSNDELYFHRAVLLNKGNFPEPALADFKKAWSLKKEEKYALGISTILLDRKPDSAIAFLTGALNDLPNSFLLRLSLARSYDARSRTDDALRICNDILSNDPGQVDVLKLKADLLDKKGNINESISTLETAYRLTSLDPEIDYQLAYDYAESRSDKTIGFCDSLIKKDSLGGHAEPFYFKGLYFSNINNKERAIVFFDEAIQHDYSYLNAYVEKGKALYDQKKYRDAIKVFELANTISATFADAYFWKGKCQEALGQKDEAKLNYQRAYGLDKTFTEAKEAADRIKN